MAESSPITGRCLCGRVRFEVSEPLLEAEYCHCKRCQRRTGTTASASALTAPGTFRVTEGEELLGAFKPDDGWHDYFCRECGGHLYGQSHEDPRLICVPMGVPTTTLRETPLSVSRRRPAAARSDHREPMRRADDGATPRRPRLGAAKVERLWRSNARCARATRLRGHGDR